MERPILFNGEMIKAILDGRKTQTRRIIKPQPPNDCNIWAGWVISSTAKKEIGAATWTDVPGVLINKEHNVKCSYGMLGDLLWVRETWRIIGWHDGEPLYLEYKDGIKLEEPGDSSDYDEDKYLQLYLDCSDDCQKAGLNIGENEEYDLQGKNAPTRWRPSIYMPRWASRLNLKITNVRVERLQKINKDECLAEGIEGHTENFGPKSNPETIYAAFPEKDGGFLNIRDAFEALWDSINAKRGYSWDSNPWVWVIEFEKIGI